MRAGSEPDDTRLWSPGEESSFIPPDEKNKTKQNKNFKGFEQREDVI